MHAPLAKPTIETSHRDPQGHTDPDLNPEVYEAYAKDPIPPRRASIAHMHAIASRLDLEECRKAAVKIMIADTPIFIVRRSDGQVVWEDGYPRDPDAPLDTAAGGDNNDPVTKPDKGS